MLTEEGKNNIGKQSTQNTELLRWFLAIAEFHLIAVRETSWEGQRFTQSILRKVYLPIHQPGWVVLHPFSLVISFQQSLSDYSILLGVYLRIVSLPCLLMWLLPPRRNVCDLLHCHLPDTHETCILEIHKINKCDTRYVLQKPWSTWCSQLFLEEVWPNRNFLSFYEWLVKTFIWC